MDVVIAHDGAREALVEAMGMNAALGKRLVQYLALFRPPHRQLTMDRVAKLLREIAPCIKEARIERNGRIWPIPQESWSLALDEIVAKKDKLTLPLKSHGYLFEMLIGAADKVEAKAEQATETRRAQGALPPGQSVVVRSGPAAVADFVRTPMPDDTRQLLTKMKRKGG
jgi:hypothetical protein